MKESVIKCLFSEIVNPVSTQHVVVPVLCSFGEVLLLLDMETLHDMLFVCYNLHEEKALIYKWSS